jgi:Mg-chelatase subunit ChlD
MPTVTVASLWPLALLAALPVIWWRARNTGTTSGRRTVAAALRSLALIAIAVALTRPVLHRPSDAISVVYLFDVSRSMSTEFLDEALRWAAELERRHRPAQSRVMAFAQGVRQLEVPAQVRALASAAEIGPGSGGIRRGGTDLEDALLSALPGFAPGHARRIVLVSDGNETQGDVWRAALRLRAENARVYAVPAAPAVDSDAWIASIHIRGPTRAREDVEVETRVFSRAEVAARLELSVAGGAPVSRPVALVPGDNRFVLNARFARAGAQLITVRVSADGDQLPTNDALTQEALVAPAVHALYVEGGAGGGHLPRALEAQGIRVSVAPPQSLAGRPDPLAGKDVLILSDVRADALGPQAAQRVRRFVRDEGGGLIFAAGENTYGAEGYAEGPIERLLPVTFETKRKRQDLDLVLLLDRSASMRRGKIEVAKSAAMTALDLPDPEQRLAVIVFDAQPHDIVTLAPVGDKRVAAERIARITSSGQTNIHAALVRARDALAGSQAQVKHIVLLSDGLTSPPPGVKVPRVRYLRGDDLLVRNVPIAILGGFAPIMDELAGANVTLSTVILGEGPDVELMTALAEWGNGRTHLARSDEDVPRLFAGETRRVRGEATVEESFQARVKALSPALAGVNFARAPALKGYVESKAKRFSDVLLEVKPGMPLLVETHYGLGKTVGFLSDVKNRWAADWLGWSGYAKLWAPLVRDSARRAAGAGLSWHVRRDGGSAVVELTALERDGSFRTDLVPEVRAIAPGGATTRATLHEVAPARYRARIPVSGTSTNPWRFELLSGGGVARAEAERAGGRSLFQAYPDEDRSRPANLPLLRTLSEQTGGALAPPEAEIFRPRGDGGCAAPPCGQSARERRCSRSC